MAITEAQPSDVANSQNSTLMPLRNIQHKDSSGNPIADPDRSNPTRNRWERPLDTIRAFEAAIDGSYSSRKSYIRSDSEGQAGNRRSSYFGGSQVGEERNRYYQNSYYARPPPQRPDSYVDGRPNGMSRPGSYYQGYSADNNPNNGYQPNRARYPRTASEPRFNNTVYQGPGYQPSYETVASGSGSSQDPAGYMTDPSSENSSVDRVTALPSKVDNYSSSPSNGYGHPSQQQYGGNGAQRQGDGYQNQDDRSPAVLRKDITPRVPIKLGATSGNAQPQQTMQRPSPAEKRKSWFGKRFSKN